MLQHYHLLMTRLKFWFLLHWHKLRVQKWVVKLIGRQFTRSNSKIEIDITYKCNLRCMNCNRSCRQAPDRTHIKVDDVRKFVHDSINHKHYWERIRILGGEPTLHPEFEDILHELLSYKIRFPRTRIEIVTNGFGKQVRRNLLRIPPMIHIENTNKTSSIQETFEAFNLAPIDDPKFKNTVFSSACSNISECGMALTPMGYYPCAISGGIDRITKWNLGRKQFPESDDYMHDILNKSCALCGRFKSGIFIPYSLRKKIVGEPLSKTWSELYSDWQLNKKEM